MKRIKVGYKSEPKFTEKELSNLKKYQDAFTPDTIKYTAANVVRIGTSLFLADII